MLLLGTVAVKALEMVWLGHQYEFITGSLGAFFIALAYFLNWRYKDKVCGC
jgi:hypothetical protein